MKVSNIFCMITLGQEYLSLVEKYRKEDENTKEQTHVHHILPRCCGGKDSLDNLVRVSIYHHVMLHKAIFNGTKGLNMIQRDKLLYAYEKMKSTYLEGRVRKHKKRKVVSENKKNSKRYKEEQELKVKVKNELRGIHYALTILKGIYRSIPDVDISLLTEIKHLLCLTDKIRSHPMRYKQYGRYSKLYKKDQKFVLKRLGFYVY